MKRKQKSKVSNAVNANVTGTQTSRKPLPLSPVVQNDLFEYEHFEVVKSESFPNTRKPVMTISNRQIYFNPVCMGYFPGVDYILPLVGRNEKFLVIRASNENERNSLKWYSAKEEKCIPRHITGLPFANKIFRMMDWGSEHRFKIVGVCVLCRGVQLLVFDLTASLPHEQISYKGKNPEKTLKKWIPVDSGDEFGLTFAEHCKRYQAELFEKFVIPKQENESEPELPLPYPPNRKK